VPGSSAELCWAPACLVSLAAAGSVLSAVRGLGQLGGVRIYF